ADPAHCGRGLGRAVTLATLHRFRELGRRDAVLETDPPRLPAIRLYLALGFRPEPFGPEDDDCWRSVLAALGADPNTLLPEAGIVP
ncbi:MAG: GNAT family N-acetyltransferase, partial [Chloroflexota bacterium]|nr:GNAT family N-acetyltransferase [Chloroflexota bacterium]